jgi:hypothetical protein
VKIFSESKKNCYGKVLEGRKGLALVRLVLLFELLLELGVGLLEIAEVVLEEPHLSSPLLLQLVKFPLKIDVLRQLGGMVFDVEPVILPSRNVGGEFIGKVPIAGLLSKLDAGAPYNG